MRFVRGEPTFAQPGQLPICSAGDDDDGVEVPVAIGLEEQGNVRNRDRPVVTEAGQPSRDAGEDDRMDDSFQVAARLCIFEHDPSKGRPVELTIRPDHFVTESPDYRIETGTARRHGVSRQHVRIDRLRS